MVAGQGFVGWGALRLSRIAGREGQGYAPLEFLMTPVAAAGTRVLVTRHRWAVIEPFGDLEGEQGRWWMIRGTKAWCTTKSFPAGLAFGEIMPRLPSQ